ncbi:DUF885 domain-containing protein [Aurantivibrio infirmus]
MSVKLKYFIASLLIFSLLACERESRVAEDFGVDSQSESQRLTQWLNQQFEQELDQSPQWRTRLGDKKDYDLLDDQSELALEKSLQWRRNSVAKMQQEFDYELLSEDAKTSYDIWKYSLDRAEKSYIYRRHAYLLGRGGPQSSLPNFLINFHKIENLQDAEDYISRLNQLAKVITQYLARSQVAAKENIRQPRFDYDFAIAEIDRVLLGFPFKSSRNDQDNTDAMSPLWSDFDAKVNALVEQEIITEKESVALLNAAKNELLTNIQPAYLNVKNWLVEDSKNAGELAQGVWALPDGENYYSSQLNLMTTLEITAEEIHQTGLREVKRIREEMEEIKSRVGFEGTLQEFFVHLRTDEQFYLPNTDQGREAYLSLATRYLDDMDERLPDFFGLLPKADLVVKRVESFREQDGAAQHYNSGAPDGSRPGVFYAHLSDMRAMPKYQLEVIAYHEGNPGHHMQISIAQELTTIPRFRTQYGYTAFVEGWALYSEALGKEMGFFEDPYSDFGRLSTEIWRAIRLVVDTGLHSKQWTEEQAVQYFMENSPQPESAIRSEIQRYLSWPGQATAYKIGMLKIQELRQRAKVELAGDFDIGEFHDIVLGGGALPLPVLEARVLRWLELKKKPNQ